MSFSGGKDSTVMLHLVMDEAIQRGRKVGLLFVDLEGQYKLTIDHVQECYDRYADHIDPHWVALPLNLRNAVSVHQPQWRCFDPECRDAWIREPPASAVTDESAYPFFRPGMEFEEFVPDFGHWYSQGQSTACFVGIRSDESLNRFRTLISETKTTVDGKQWTTWLGGSLVNVYPIYDWRTEDIWTYHAQFPEEPYNRLYDRMWQAGLTIHQARICQPYGDDQRRGLWLFHLIEPETWAKVVARVEGANGGALYVRESGNITGMRTISRPAGHTWESYATYLLDTLPPHTAEHYRNKIAVFIHWWMERGYPTGIPDESDPKLEASKDAPSWRRICKMLLRNDYWGKGLSFSPQRSTNVEQYLKVMKNRRQKWGILAR